MIEYVVFNTQTPGKPNRKQMNNTYRNEQKTVNNTWLNLYLHGTQAQITYNEGLAYKSFCHISQNTLLDPYSECNNLYAELHR